MKDAPRKHEQEKCKHEGKPIGTTRDTHVPYGALSADKRRKLNYSLERATQT